MPGIEDSLEDRPGQRDFAICSRLLLIVQISGRHIGPFKAERGDLLRSDVSSNEAGTITDDEDSCAKQKNWFADRRLPSGLCVAQAQSDRVCAFSPPEGWVQSAVRWEGACHAGVADGLGVLKEFGGKNVKRLFFGVVKNGELKSGVIDQEDGYITGSFEHGRLVQSQDRQTAISAFDKAAAAANETAKRFEKAGNKASSRFYQAKAKSLREQVD